MKRGVPLSYSRLNEELLERFPALRGRYEDLRITNAGEDLGPHVSFDLVLVPYIRELLQTGDDEFAIRRAFAFLEEMAREGSEKVKEVVSASVLESLLGERQLALLVMPWLGPATSRLAKSVMED